MSFKEEIALWLWGWNCEQNGNVFFKKNSHNSGSLNVFTNQKLQKNARGYTLIEFENFRKKTRIVPKKPKGEPLVSPLLLEA